MASPVGSWLRWGGGLSDQIARLTIRIFQGWDLFEMHFRSQCDKTCCTKLGGRQVAPQIVSYRRTLARVDPPAAGRGGHARAGTDQRLGGGGSLGLEETLPAAAGRRRAFSNPGPG